MADIMMFVASVEWIVLGILTFWKLRGWNKKMDELYEDMKKQWEELSRNVTRLMKEDRK